ncbi:type 1 glutamine amidotransferase domain-containing protein [Winogradskyella sediminis]|uniref:type 1 glutamine amidotransferase domain-containing protein n=1 Tax=Winogradskyella sediminis TaxID=1382466 RepID=UPI003AA7DA64
MFKKYKILKWLLTSLGIIILFIVALGLYIASLLPEENPNIKNSQASDITYINEAIPSYRGKILAVVTSTDTMGLSGKATGFELTELARAYYVFKANGFDVDVASPLGGEAPVVLDDDDMGRFDYAFLNDSITKQKIKQTIALEDVESNAYKAIYFVGGKGAMFDFPDNKHIQRMVQDFQKANKIIGAVCHGPAALTKVTLDNGEPFVKYRTVSGFTNAEELLLIPDADSIFPFLLQDKLIAQGAVFNEGNMYLEKISVDKNLVTGQNPWSVWALAENMIQQLGYTPKERAVTADENTVKILYTYETQGIDKAKDLIKECIQKKQNVSRSLFIDHGAIAVLTGKLSKFYDMLRLAAYTKETQEHHTT